MSDSNKESLFVGFKDAILTEVTDKEQAEFYMNDPANLGAGDWMDEAGVYIELSTTQAQHGQPREVKYCRVGLLFEEPELEEALTND